MNGRRCKGKRRCSWHEQVGFKPPGTWPVVLTWLMTMACFSALTMLGWRSFRTCSHSDRSERHSSICWAPNVRDVAERLTFRRGLPIEHKQRSHTTFRIQDGCRRIEERNTAQGFALLYLRTCSASMFFHGFRLLPFVVFRLPVHTCADAQCDSRAL